MRSAATQKENLALNNDPLTSPKPGNDSALHFIKLTPRVKMTGSYTDSEEETFDILSEDQGAIDRNIDAMIQDVEAGQMNNEARVQRLEGVSTSEDEDDSDREQEALASQIRQLKNEFREIRGSVAALQTSALVDGKARMIDDWIEKMLRTQPVDNVSLTPRLWQSGRANSV